MCGSLPKYTRVHGEEFGLPSVFATKHVVVSGNRLSILNMAPLSYESVESGGVEEVVTQRNFVVEQSAQLRCSGRTFTRFCNSHGYASDPPDDRDVTRIVDPTGVSM